MKRFIGVFLRLIDFCICACFFPSAVRIIKCLQIPGLHAIAEKYFLYMISENLSVKGDILEIGSYEGASSIVLALGNESSHNKGKVWLVEPFPMPNKTAFLNIFKTRGLEINLILIDKTSADSEQEIHSSFRFIFIDGNHEYEYVKKDIVLWEKHLVEGGVIAFHNIDRESVARAVREWMEKTREYKTLGLIARTFYAVKGNCKDTDLISKFNKLGRIRQKLTFTKTLDFISSPGQDQQ